MKDILRHPVTRALIALIIVFVIGVIFNAERAFFKWGTHRDMLRQVSVYGILACGMTLVIITGGIDLSVGSILGLAAVTFSIFSIKLGWSATLAVLACLAIGTVCGLVSGTFISFSKIQPFIATLAMMVFARGLAKQVSGGQKIASADELPAIFDRLNSSILARNISMVTIVLLVCLVVCWVVLGKLRWGRYVYAVGGNEEAARLSGAPVTATKLLAYGLSGLFSAVAGICQAAQEQQGDPEAGGGYELNAIAIVVIGGTSLAGGRGSIWLTLLGALTIGYLEKILSINAIPEAGRLMLTGAIVIAAVLFQKTRK